MSGSDSNNPQRQGHPSPSALTLIQTSIDEVSPTENPNLPASPRTLHPAKKQKIDGGEESVDAEIQDVEMSDGEGEKGKMEVSVSSPSSVKPDTSMKIEAATVPLPNIATSGNTTHPTLIEALPDIQSQSETHHNTPTNLPSSSELTCPPTPPTPGTPADEATNLPFIPEADFIQLDENKVPEKTWDLRMSWAGKVFDFQVAGEDRLFDLKVSRSN